jgi:hypothetical protein
MEKGRIRDKNAGSATRMNYGTAPYRNDSGRSSNTGTTPNWNSVVFVTKKLKLILLEPEDFCKRSLQGLPIRMRIRRRIQIRTTFNQM